MGLIFGKITVETPKYELLKTTPDYEIRKYQPHILAQVTYDPTQMKNNNKDGGFMILANYIGALGKPQNIKPEKIDMTAPLITKDVTASENVAMTAPVVTKESSQEEKKLVTMQFILPSKYTKVEETPKPLDERVVIKEEEEKKYGVSQFSWFVNEKVVAEKVGKLKECLERDGYNVIGEYLLARYNPPSLTLPMFRTNEVMFQVE